MTNFSISWQVFLGLLAIGLALMNYLSGNYNFALIWILISIFLLIFAKIRIWVNDKIPLAFVWVYFFGQIVIACLITNSLSDYLMRISPKHEECGKVENIYYPPRGGLATFDLVNNTQKISEFNYYEYKSQIKEYKYKVCIVYSIAEGWGDNPYIHQLRPFE